MSENKALAGLLRQKNHSIPLAVRYWLFFKTHVLEKPNVRIKFAKRALNFEQFCQLMKGLLKGSPTRGRNKSKKWKQILDHDMMQVLFIYHNTLLGHDCDWIVKEAGKGLGLFAKHDFTWSAKEHQKRLFGIVCNVGADDFAVLQKNKYPSLFSSRGVGDGILFGPASLLNHSCQSRMRWTEPSKRGVPDLFEGFHALRLQHRQQKKAHITFKRNEEITTCYGMSRKDFDCGCEKCKVK